LKWISAIRSGCGVEKTCQPVRQHVSRVPMALQISRSQIVLAGKILNADPV